MKFMLDIYTWPAMEGANPDVDSTTHDALEIARDYLDSFSRPYSHAVLQHEVETGKFAPCNWDGNPIAQHAEWPMIHGANYGRSHPAVEAVRADFDNLAKETYSIWEASGGAMIDIAADLLKSRHPEICGWAKEIAWAAAGIRR